MKVSFEVLIVGDVRKTYIVRGKKNFVCLSTVMELTQEYNTCLNDNEKNNQSNKDGLFLRCMRKKYKCLLIWFLSIASLSQFLYLILDKIDVNILEAMLKKILQNLTLQNSTNV